MLSNLLFVCRFIRLKRRCVRYVFLCFIFCFILAIYSQVNQQTQVKQHQEGIVEGWEVNVSRNTRLYVQPDKDTSIIAAADICDSESSVFLLVVICSAVSNFDRRQAIRVTWASNLSDEVRVAFMLGKSDNSSLQALVKEESSLKSDIIQEDFIDSYNNLTVKSIMMLKWVQRHCDSIRFLMKTDDDLFVQLDALVVLLKLNNASRGLLFGALVNGSKPILDSGSKWYIPSYMFDGQIYPNYLSGSGYVMSHDVIRRLYHAALDTPLIYIEDLYITGICAKRAGILQRDFPRFSYERMDLTESCNLYYLTNHRLKLEDLYFAWSYLLNCSTTTDQIKLELLSSEYIFE